MYRTCLFCHANLGSNETLELLPVGRRVAFDADKGRLWVVCRSRGRWNLTPLEARWEAIEEAEKAFLHSKLRAATENIALARAKEGAELVRIGRAEPLELASWRYGSGLRRRWAMQWAFGGAMGAVALGSFAFGGGALLAAVPGGVLIPQLPQLYYTYRLHFAVLARIDAGGETQALIRGRHAMAARLENPGEGHRLIVRHSQGRSTLEGDAAIGVASRLLVRLNLGGASNRALREAMSYLDSTRTNAGPIDHISRTLPGSLASLPNHARLALEIATHEEAERQAVAEEMTKLEDAWREAEEIASIADNLLLPEWIPRRLGQLRASADQPNRDGA